MKPKVVVAGSVNTDFVVHLDRIPAKGETVLGGKFFKAQGGKGANQAVAAARMGAEVTFVARVGEDDLGRAAQAAYRQEGINTRYLSSDPDESSGVALIMVNREGENIIAVASGANLKLTPRELQAAEPAIREAGCLLLQLEVPLETVSAAIHLAKAHGVRVVLNPAPAAPLSVDLLQQVDVLTPNENEACRLADMPSGTSPVEVAGRLSSQYSLQNLVITLGADGALVFSEGRMQKVPAFPIQPVDTTAAGDAFNGALAVMLARGLPLVEAVHWANAAGALAATRAGAQPSLPTEAEVAQLVAKQP